MPSQSSIDMTNSVFAAVFGRAPASGELAATATAVDAGMTRAEMARMLATSPEGLARIGYVYQDVLGRGAAQSDLANSSAYLGTGAGSIAALTTMAATSAEAQASIHHVYQDLLGRAPSLSEVAIVQLALEHGLTLTELRADAYGSTEAKAVIQALYQGYLGRAASAEEVTNVQHAMAQGTTIGELRTSAATSTEAQAALTHEFETSTGAPPSHDMLAIMTQQLQAGATLASLQAGGFTANPTPPATTPPQTTPPGTGAPAPVVITSVTPNLGVTGGIEQTSSFLTIAGTGQPSDSIIFDIMMQNGHGVTSPFPVATVGSDGHWSVTNTPGSGSPGAGIPIPDGIYTVNPKESNGSAQISGNPVSLQVATAPGGIHFKMEAFNPAISMIETYTTARSPVSPSAPAPAATSLDHWITQGSGMVPALHG